MDDDDFGIKIQNVVDKLDLTPLTEEGRKICSMSIRGTAERWYSFADILEAVLKRLD